MTRTSTKFTVATIWDTGRLRIKLNKLSKSNDRHLDSEFESDSTEKTHIECNTKQNSP